jgi:hypothetical protein
LSCITTLKLFKPNTTPQVEKADGGSTDIAIIPHVPMAHAHLNLLKPFTRQTVQTIRDILTRQTRPPESVSYDAVTRRYLYKGERERIVEINRAHAKKAMVKAETAGTAGRLDEAPREAAVLLPLVNFRREDLGKHRADQVNVDQGMSGKAIEHGDIVPGILFQVRAGHMRMHAGEVR